MRWIAALIVAASTASAATIDESKGDARYLEYGRTFAEYVVRVVGHNREGIPLAGSGTIVAPHWVLTAAHVTHEMTSVEIVVGTERHRVDRVFPHRHWTGEFARDDIALVHVARPFSPSVYPRLSDGTERLGTVAAVAGYGMTGTIQRGLTGGDQRLRAGSVLLGVIERDCYVCPIRRDALAGPLPACIAPGDSGGPLWAKAADGTTRIVGVNSYVARTGGKTRYTLGEESGHTRVAKYLSWIHEVAGPLDEQCILPGCHENRLP